jgi:NAD(P)-dependent dehydrogenase (short-subunit alcohol dehydrogenase family)
MAQTAVIAGVGPGLGASLARKFAHEGLSLGLLARSGQYIADLADDLAAETPVGALAVETDITDRTQVEDAFDAVREEYGPVDVLVNHASGATWEGVDVDPDAFERSLQVGPMGSLHCTQQAVPDMREDGGTIIFTGATSALRGREGALGFSAAKFATRGMAESLARELGPVGIHVAHVVIDGQIATPSAVEAADRSEEKYLDPDAIAESYWHLVQQDRSSWTLELDLRPHLEEF